MTDNLTLWNKVRTPDPEHTKKFQVAGGFKGTSTDAMYLVKRATEIWGQIGKGWGYREDDRVITNDVWYSYVVLWYTEDGERYAVYHWGGSPIKIINKDGKERIDDEAAKKAFTNGLSKCLSQLGFAADIYMGLFDDDKYVQAAAEKFKEPEFQEPSTDTNLRFKAIQQDLMACETPKALKDVLAIHRPAIQQLQAGAEQVREEMNKSIRAAKEHVALMLTEDINRHTEEVAFGTWWTSQKAELIALQKIEPPLYDKVVAAKDAKKKQLTTKE